MYTIGLTGGIATGKSTVAELLRQLGAAVVDADAVSRALTAPGGEALPAIREAFGDGVFDGETLNRRALADLIFDQEDARLRLNALMFPRIVSGVRVQLERLAAQGTDIAVVDMPLLFESGFAASVDAIWICRLPLEQQITRLMARNRLTRQEALARIRSQKKELEASGQFGITIDTGGSPEALHMQVIRAWEALPR